jgi:hypothetical protein
MINFVFILILSYTGFLLGSGEPADDWKRRPSLHTLHTASCENMQNFCRLSQIPLPWNNSYYIQPETYSIGNVDLSTNIVNALGKNHRPAYRNVAKAFKENRTQEMLLELRNEHLSIHRRMWMFENVYTDADGWIVDQSTKNYRVRGGACPVERNWHSEAFANKIKSYDNVISFTGLYSGGIFHFPMEYMTALAHLPGKLSDSVYSHYKIHVYQKKKYIIDWLALFEVSPDRVIEGYIAVKNLLVPQPAKCGNPSTFQLEWFREQMRIKTSIFFESKSSNIKLNDVQNKDNNNKIVLIQRSASRRVSNTDAISQTLQQQIKKLNISSNIVIHDAKSLPSLQEQIIRFTDAQIIVAPHGAGLLFSTFAQPNACIIEFMYPNKFVNICFFQTSVNLGHHHIGIDMDPKRNIVDIKALEKAINMCAKFVKNYSNY